VPPRKKYYTQQSYALEMEREKEEREGGRKEMKKRNEGEVKTSPDKI
jgi:hypothetical protein